MNSNRDRPIILISRHSTSNKYNFYTQLGKPLVVILLQMLVTDHKTLINKTFSLTFLMSETRTMVKCLGQVERQA